MKDRIKILVVDDELGIRDLLSSELGLRGYDVVTACNGKEAVAKAKAHKFRLVISDVKMPHMTGLELLEAVRELDPEIEVILSTGHGTIETAVSAMKKGAYDFIQKPFNLDELLGLVERALERTELKALVGLYEASKAIFASQAAQAIHNARLYGELQRRLREIREMQEQLIHSEKLAAVGQLAAGVAHEINNPLTGIMGFAQLLLQGDGLAPEQREDVANILHQSKRCRKIVQNLLQFGRRTEVRREAARLAEILAPTLELIGHDFRMGGIEIRTEIPADLPPIFGDAAQLEQVFLNIIANARHAMKNRTGGLLRISAAATPQGRVEIRFEDNGCGIPADRLPRIFDPFFTTKPVGEGTGLGLSISYGIVKDHAGTIRAESRVGKGTRLIVELPIRKIGAEHECREACPDR